MRQEIKLVYSPEEMINKVPVPNMNIPELQEEACLVPPDGTPYMVVKCSPKEKYYHGCPYCGSVNIVKNGFADKPRIVHDVNIGLTRVDLIINVPRYKCLDCSAGFRHKFDTIPDNRHCTKRLYEQIKNDAFTRPFADVASSYGYTEASVRNIFDEYAAELEANREKIIAPEILGIDEKHIGHKMRAVFIDISTGRLLEMTKDNKGSTVIDTITNMKGYENIRLVTTDMANGYRADIKVCLPYATQIVDKFHVIQRLSVAVKKSKTNVYEAINERISMETDPTFKKTLVAVKQKLDHNNYLFKYNKNKILQSAKRLEIMTVACATFPELNHLRLLKEGFERIYESKDRAEAESRYLEWKELVPPARKNSLPKWEQKYNVKAELYEDFKVFANTLHNWHDEIFAYFDLNCQFTNAASEGVNSLIQRINAQGAGYGFNRLRAKALYWSQIRRNVSYSLKTSKEPVYETIAASASAPSNGFSMSFFTPEIHTSSRRLIGYADKSEVVSTGGEFHRPVSVFDYIDKTSEYYDFYEDAELSDDCEPDE